MSCLLAHFRYAMYVASKNVMTAIGATAWRISMAVITNASLTDC
jgi:hypothetical protein